MTTCPQFSMHVSVSPRLTGKHQFDTKQCTGHKRMDVGIQPTPPCTILGTHLLLGVNVQSLTATHTWLAPATGHHSSMAGHATALGQDTLSSVHATNILWAGLNAAQDDLNKRDKRHNLLRDCHPTAPAYPHPAESSVQLPIPFHPSYPSTPHTVLHASHSTLSVYPAHTMHQLHQQ